MSEHMKTRRIRKEELVYVTLSISKKKPKSSGYSVLSSDLSKVEAFLENLQKADIEPWEKTTPWEELAKNRIEKYKKAGIVLRGARYREGMSQKQLAKKSKVSQDNISKIENGKRTVGKEVAKRLAKALNFDYKLLIEL